MFGFHAWDLLIVLLIVILLFGARRLPELGSSLGKSFSMFQKGMNGDDQPAIEGEKEREPTPRPESVSAKDSER